MMQKTHQFMPFLVVILLFLMLGPQAVLAQRTGLVVIANGDRLTGDVRQLERNQLRFATDSMGSVRVDWDDVLRLTSTDELIIELAEGRRLRSALLDSGVDRILAVKVDGELVLLEISEVVRIDEVMEGGVLVDRWSGQVSVGFNYTKANNTSAFSGAFDARRRDKHFEIGIDAAFFVRSQDEVSDTRRFNLGGEYQRLLEARRYWVVLGLLERNDELGVDLRSLGGLGYGKFLRRSNRNSWSADAGIVLVNEQRDDEPSRNEVEGYLNSRYEYFLYDSPETSLNTSLTVFPGISDSGRIRSNLAFSARRELVSDLFLELRIYGSFDNRPPENAERSDYGLVTGLGFSF